eukprot:TRINITY_DN27805_c0_g1_i1.p1 TRINITY_DN27805_c0_g1~~TRINITY_DN27805_c0_g1_i1.p1  ORF type:complete len:788 (+),score=197.58 TRINITY_DN27805_c0_g1_i1:36-2366(+)
MAPKLKVQTGNVKVMVRVRPFSKREKAYSEDKGQPLNPCIKADGCRIAVLDPENEYQEKDAFSYDEVFWSTTGYDSVNGFSGQNDVYLKTGAEMLRSALDGYNCCIFAYGQTGAGKTYTMLGSPDSRGVSYILIDELFQHIEQQKELDPGTKCTVEVSFMEIYNEQVRDLFNKKTKAGEYSPVKIRQDPVKGIQVVGLITKPVCSASECAKEMERGVSERALAETKMNATSSRSHAICQISILLVNPTTGLRKNSLINLVDLAGSERLKMSMVEGTAAKEAKNINLSLSTLRKVFDTLIANSKKKGGGKEVPPYRESMLTWVLKESLGGNSKTLMIAAISPHEENLEDTYSTLRYALKAKSIVNKVICNEQPSARMVENLRGELEALKEQLAKGGGGGGVSEEREKEFEEELQAREQALAEAMEVEVQMQEAQAELRMQVDSQRKQKFAAAFRSAFVINKDSKEREGMKDELVKLRSEAEDMLATNTKNKEEGLMYKKRSEALQTENQTLKNKSSDLEKRLKESLRDVVGTANERDKYRDRELAALQEMSSLKHLISEQTSKITTLKDECAALKTENHRLSRIAQYDLPSLREQLEEMTGKKDEAMRKKDGYKKQCVALQLIHEADTKIINALKEDRRNAQVTISAQREDRHKVQVQQTHLDQALDAAQKLKSEISKKDDLVKSLGKNLKAYQHATTEWASSSAYVRSELERVTKEHHDLKSFVTTQAAPALETAAGSPWRSSLSPSPKSRHALERSSQSPRYTASPCSPFKSPSP